MVLLRQIPRRPSLWILILAWEMGMLLRKYQKVPNLLLRICIRFYDPEMLNSSQDIGRTVLTALQEVDIIHIHQVQATEVTAHIEVPVEARIILTAPALMEAVAVHRFILPLQKQQVITH